LRIDPSSAEDIVDESCSLTELDTEDREILEEEVATGEALDEGKEEEETILNDDIEHSVIAVVPGRPRCSRS
jgi:hypothetical protein